MGNEDRKTEILVGLFLLVGLLLLGGLILRFSSVKEALKEKYKIEVMFPSAAGLVRGAPVKLGGATIGEVAERPRLNARFNGVIIKLDIFSEYQVPEGSQFIIGSSGLMGDKLLEIRPPDPKELTGKFIKADTVHVGKGASGLGAIEDAAITLTTKTEAVLGDVEEAIELLSEAVRKLDSGFLKEENAESFRRSLSGLGKAIEKIDGEILSEKNIGSVESILSGFDETAGNLREGSDSLEEAMGKLGPSIEKLEEILDKVEVAADAVKETAEAATSKVEALDRRDGLLPALLDDRKLRDDFSALVANLKSHGILRYKDSASASAAEEEKEKPGSAAGAEDRRRTRRFAPFRR